MNTIKTVKVSELLPNPYRNLKHYQINKACVEGLIESFRATGEWPGVIVRQKKDGRIERAFGEHRCEAHKELYGKNSEIDVIVMDLADADMLRYMANENGAARENTFLAQMETVQSTVEALARGEIKIKSPSLRNAHLRLMRVAPHYAPAGFKKLADIPVASTKLYNNITIAEFLGWVRPRVGAATNGLLADYRVDSSLTALRFIEEGVFEHHHFEGLGGGTAKILLDETRRAHKNAEFLATLDLSPDELAEAQERFRVEVPRRVSNSLRQGEGTRTIHEITNSLMDEIAPHRDRLPMLDHLIDQLSAQIRGFIDAQNQNQRAKKLQEVLAAQGEMSPASQEKLQKLRASLGYLGDRCLLMAQSIHPPGRAHRSAHPRKALPAR